MNSFDMFSCLECFLHRVFIFPTDGHGFSRIFAHAALVLASGVFSLISHRTHRIHRILFIIPFTLVFNSQNLQVASPLLGHPGWMLLSRASDLRMVYRSAAALTAATQLSPKRSFFHRAKHFHPSSFLIHHSSVIAKIIKQSFIYPFVYIIFVSLMQRTAL